MGEKLWSWAEGRLGRGGRAVCWASLVHCPAIHFCLWHFVAPWASLSSYQCRQIQQGTVPWSSWTRVSGSRFAPFSMHGGPSLVTHFHSAEKLFSTPDVSVTKPASHHSPTHYTFGIISYTGANHTEDLEELDICECLHNAWYASSSALLLCSLTAIERMSGFNFFPPLHLLLASQEVTITRYDSLKAHTPTCFTHSY